MAKAPKKFRLGRPKKKQPGDARDSILQVRLTVAERKALDDAAQSKSLDTSVWVRTEMLSLARKIKEGEASQWP